MERRRLSSGTGFLLVALAAALWGSDGFFRVRLALELPPATVVFMEHLILVAVTLPLVLRARPHLRHFGPLDWTALLLVGVGASATATILFTAAFRYGDPTTPLLLQKLQPLIAVLGAWLLLGERLLPRYGLYFVSGLAGAYLITFRDPFQVSVAALMPAALAVGAAALWGLGTVLGRHLTARLPFTQLTALRFAVGLPASAAILWGQHGVVGFTSVGRGDLPGLLALALVPGLAAILIYYLGLGATPASAATLAELAFPLSAVTIGYLVFDNPLTASQWAGLFILAGTITAMGVAGQRGSRAMGVEMEPSAEPQPA